MSSGEFLLFDDCFGFWSFLNHEHFPSWTHSAFHLSSYDKKNAKSAANFDQYWQSYMYAETNKQLTCGEFCYLPATLCPFPEKVTSQNAAQRKDNKVGNKTGCKKGQQKEKKECEERTLKTDSPTKKRQTLSRNARKTKILLISSNWQKNLLWVLKISFLAIPMLTSQKLLQKDLVKKMLFFCC